MSYAERYGQVVLTMSREDYDKINEALNWLAASYSLPESRSTMLRMMKRLNSGNPHYEPPVLNSTSEDRQP